jgi:hypothetical protein
MSGSCFGANSPPPPLLQRFQHGGIIHTRSADHLLYKTKLINNFKTAAFKTTTEKEKKKDSHAGRKGDILKTSLADEE